MTTSEISPLPSRSPKLRQAMIWDLDGVIVDSAAAHFTAWREFCRRHGRDLGEREFRATFGQRNEEILRILFHPGFAADDPPSDQEVQTLAEEKEILFRSVAPGHVRLFPGVLPLLASLSQACYGQAIASSAPRQNIDLLTKAVGVHNYFSAVVSAEDVKRGKPDPEIFLLAALRLGVLPEHCLVIEDAVAGVSAAKAAGMTCLAVTTTRDRQSLAEADLVVRSLEHVDLATVAMLLSGEKRT